MSDDLIDAVDRLLNPSRQRITREDGTKEHVSVRSPWEQLCQAFNDGVRMARAGSVPSARLPFDADVRDLRADIIDTVKDALNSYALPARNDLPADLRQLRTQLLSVHDDDLEAWWSYRVSSWARQIRTVLRLDEIRSRRLRNAPCPVCATSHVLIPNPLNPAEASREPAMLIEVHEERFRAITCSFCGTQWWAGEQFWALQDAIDAQPVHDQACVAWDTTHRDSA